MKNIELLAPAGTKEAFIGAINAGANAIYLAGKSFGARKYASNFTNEEIKELITYAHLRNVKVFVTINTIIFDHELTELFQYSDFLVNSKVDALIIQDLGIINEFTKRYPHTEIHASTQMNAYTVSQLEYLKSIGVKRVILARETSINQIKKLSKVGIELEVFVHGALCVSYSGNCLFSYYKGGRSGNRGECAQPCRLEYSLVKNNINTKEKTYLLSTKELNTIDNLKDIIESGVISLKIEGRMRRVEYVTATVRAYKEALENIVDNKPFDINKRIKELQVTFNREYTKGYISNIEPSSINNEYRPNHLGIKIGTVLSYKNNKAKIKLSDTLKVNDGIRIVGKNDTGGKVSRILLNNQKVQEAHNKQIIELDLLQEVDILDSVHKTLDQDLFNELKKYQSENYKLIPLKIKLEMFTSNRIYVEAETPYHTVTFYSDFIIEEAKQNPQTKEQILASFNKFGNTYFKIEDIKIKSDFDGFIPNSILKKLRRTLVQNLEEKALIKTSLIEKKNTIPKLINTTSELIVKVESNDQLEIAKSLGINNIYYTKNVKVAEVDKEQYYLYIDRIHDEPSIQENNIVVHDYGLIHKYKNKSIIGSSYLNVSNSLAIHHTSVKRITLSQELDLNQIKDLTISKPLEYVVYTRPDMMISKYCPITKSEGVYKENCNLCMKHTYHLEDKENNRYPLIRDHLCNMRILNSKVVTKDSYIKELLKRNISLRIDLTIESKEQTRQVLAKYLKQYNQNKKA